MKRWLNEAFWAMLPLLAIVALLAVIGGWVYRNQVLVPRWEEEARQASIKKRELEEREHFLDEAREFAAGKRTFQGLSKEMQDAIWAADEFNHRNGSSPVYPELYEIIPGLRAPKELSGEPTKEQFLVRRKAFLESPAYRALGDSQVRSSEYFHLDRSELIWLDDVGSQINNAQVAQVKTLVERLPDLPDCRFLALLNGALGCGQHYWSATVKGLDPNDMGSKNHDNLSDALIAACVTGGHEYYVPDKKSGNGIWIPTREQPKDSAYHFWNVVVNPAQMREGHAFQGRSVEPPVLLDLSGRVVAIQVSPRALRVSYFDGTKPAEGLITSLISLAHVIGVTAKSSDKAWTLVDEKTHTWELKIGS